MVFAVYNFALFFFALRLLDKDSVENHAACALEVTLISSIAYALSMI